MVKSRQVVVVTTRGHFLDILGAYTMAAGGVLEVVWGELIIKDRMARFQPHLKYYPWMCAS